MRGLTKVLVFGFIFATLREITGTQVCPTDLPEDPLEDILLPHESDCSKFYKCSHGEAVLQDCPEGLHFNTETNQCDWPHNVQCENNSSVPAFENKIDEDCPISNSTEEILLPHEYDCSKFYQCSHGQKVLQNCSVGLHFNPKTKQCDWPENAGCQNDSNSSSIEDNQSEYNDVCPAGVNVLLPHELDCSMFYECEDGEKSLYSCTKGLHFNNKTKLCDWPENAKCVIKPNTSSESSEEGEENSNNGDCPLKNPSVDILFPHEFNCSQFYKCTHGEKVIQDCPEGLYFNPDVNFCDWPENVNCSIPTRYLAHEDDCTKFYQVHKGIRHEYMCSVGLHFNPILQMCTSGSNIRCNKKSMDKSSEEFSQEMFVK